VPEAWQETAIISNLQSHIVLVRNCVNLADECQSSCLKEMGPFQRFIHAPPDFLTIERLKKRLWTGDSPLQLEEIIEIKLARQFKVMVVDANLIA
jgi:hypothetical protein